MTKKEERILKEHERLDSMMEFERKYNEFDFICGIDEVGRGPLAGPVVAASVILPKEHYFLYLNDSKKVTEKRREVLYDEITTHAIAWAVGIVSPEVIDDINILQATYLAMQQSLDKLEIQPQMLFVDAVHIPNVSVPQIGIIKGDAKSVSIAAASIVAKVTRDRMMQDYDILYPEYHFASNKGYGTKVHMDALRSVGPCPIHRNTFVHL